MIGRRTPLEVRFWRKVRKTDGCWFWIGSDNGVGYGIISAGGKRGRTLEATHVMWQLIHGEPVPPDMHVLHHCDTPPCVRPDHLFLGTPQDNMKDARDKGRLFQLSRLTRSEVLSIERDYPEREQAEIATRLGISRAHVALILNRNGWDLRSKSRRLRRATAMLERVSNLLSLMPPIPGLDGAINNGITEIETYLRPTIAWPRNMSSEDIGRLTASLRQDAELAAAKA